MLGFDDYPDIADAAATTCSPAARSCRTRPRDRRTLLPITPGRAAGARRCRCPGTRRGRGPGWTPPVLRRRLERLAGRPAQAGLGLRPALRVLRDPVLPRRVRLPAGRTSCSPRRRWLAEQGVRELVLVSENSTSYGKDLGDLRLLEKLLPELAAVDGHRPGPGVLPAAGRDAPVAGRGDRRHARRRAVLRPVLPARQRGRAAPDAPVRRHRARSSRCSTRSGRWRRRPGSASNVIVGFPGETEADVAELSGFLTAARLDAIGVFGYSDEDGTEAAGLRRQARRGRDRRAGRPDHRAGRGADGAAGRGADRRDRRGAGRGGHRRRRWRAARRTRRRRSTARRWSPARRWTRRSATWSGRRRRRRRSASTWSPTRPSADGGRERRSTLVRRRAVGRRRVVPRAGWRGADPRRAAEPDRADPVQPTSRS